MIECIRGEVTWNTYEYKRDGVPLGFAQWRKQGESAEFHNVMYQQTRSALLASKKLFQDLKSDMAQAGCTHVVVTDLDEHVDAVRLKYWRFMGFSTTGRALGYTFAVMEVSCQQQSQ